MKEQLKKELKIISVIVVVALLLPYAAYKIATESNTTDYLKPIPAAKVLPIKIGGRSTTNGVVQLYITNGIRGTQYSLYGVVSGSNVYGLGTLTFQTLDKSCFNIGVDFLQTNQGNTIVFQVTDRK